MFVETNIDIDTNIESRNKTIVLNKKIQVIDKKNKVIKVNKKITKKELSSREKIKKTSLERSGEKSIILKDKNTIDKLNNTKSKRLITEDWNIDNSIFTNRTKQLNILHSHYSILDNDIYLKELDKYSLNNIIYNEIINKRSGYRYQDINKKIFNEPLFISYNEIVELLIASKLKCYYCKEDIFILYEDTRHNKQWTLDRINNNNGHNSMNCVIACLDCNVKRKTMNKEKFLFSKQIQFIKSQE